MKIWLLQSKFIVIVKDLAKLSKTNIFLSVPDDRTWLHVEVTPEGLATNIHLVGQSEEWHNKLQAGLLNWDHDKNIVDNIMTIFGNFISVSNVST